VSSAEATRDGNMLNGAIVYGVCAMWQKRLTIKDDLFSEAFKSINSAVNASEILQ
jgi:hypothetical protein